MSLRAEPPCVTQPHRFADYVNGHILSHGFREGIVFDRKCIYCDQTEADILKRATPEHVEGEA